MEADFSFFLGGKGGNRKTREKKVRIESGAD